MSRPEQEREQSTETPSVGWIVEALREAVPVRPEWRAAVLRELGTLPAPAGRGTRGAPWRLRPLTAIAAGLACALAGAGTTALLLRQSSATPIREAAANLTTAAAPSLAGDIDGRSVVRFVFVAPYAAHVALVGDFNGWNPQRMPMRRSADARAWIIDVPLAPGRHVYSFFVDGDLTADPAAPRSGDDDFGVPSSVVLVKGARM